MEVAAALLDASRKLSTSSTSDGSSLSTDWKDSTSELTEKSNSQGSSGWLGGEGRTRAFSESAAGPGAGTGAGWQSWLGGWAGLQGGAGTRPPPPTGTPALLQLPPRHRVRRASSKDVEEAMAAGLGKADMYLPPI